MKNRWLILITVLIIAAILVSFIFLNLSQKNNQSKITLPTASPTIPEPSKISVTPQKKPNIIITSPKSNEKVSLPIIIKGEARVFENQLNYRVRDNKNNILLEGLGYANSPDVGQFGPFTIQIDSLPFTANNFLILEVFDYSAKDGTEIDKVRVPIQLDTANTMLIKVFFGGKQAPAGEECTTVYPLTRRIVKTQSVLRAALEELLKGPMTIEQNNGYFTSINEGVKIQKLLLSNGTAYIDFSEKLEEGVGGSCRVTAIRQQIIQTAKQFPQVKNVVISINGRTEDILQP